MPVISIENFKSTYGAGGIWGQNPAQNAAGNQPNAPGAQPNGPVPQDNPPAGPAEAEPSPREIADEVHRLVKAAADKTRRVMSGDEVADIGRKLGFGRDKTFKAVVKEFKNCAAAMEKLSGINLSKLFVTDRHGALKVYKHNQLKLDKSIQAAIDASFAASEKLGDLINALGGAGTDELPEDQVGRLARSRAVLEDLKMRCDARASELLTLSMQFASLDGAGRAALGNVSVKERFDAMDTSVMHENPDIAASEEMISLGEELATLRRDTAREEAGFDGDAARLDSRAEAVQDRLDGAGNIGETMRREVFAELDLARGRLADRKKAAADWISRRFEKAFLPGQIRMPSLFDPNHPVGREIREDTKDWPAFYDYLKRLNSYNAKLRAYLKGEENAPDKATLENELTALETGYAGFHDTTRELFSTIGGVLRSYDGPDRNDLSVQQEKCYKMFRKSDSPEPGMRVKEFRRLFNRTVDFRENHLDRIGQLARTDLANLFSGGIDICTFTEARVHGVTEDMLEKDCSDDRITDVKSLGAGEANEVLLLTFRKPDGTEGKKVFKAEAPSERGIRELHLGHNEAYTDVQQTAMLNIASCRTAEFLGTPDVISRSTVGVYNGQYGLFMDMVPGREPSALEPPAVIPEVFSRIKTDGYHSTDDAQRKMISSLNKGLVDLRWNDILTGQGDRHPGNYLVDFKNGRARVTGIDNDMSFPSYRTGITRFRLKEKWIKSIERDIAHTLSQVEGLRFKDAQTRAQELLRQRTSLKFSEEEIEVDVGNPPDPLLATALMSVTGNHAFSVPPYMSKTMHDNICDENRRNALLASWRETLDGASYEQAANRLEEMVALARRYEAEGRILETDDAWGDPVVTRNLLSHDRNIVLQPANDQVRNEDLQAFFEGVDRCCGSFLLRDFVYFINSVVE